MGNDSFITITYVLIVLSILYAAYSGFKKVRDLSQFPTFELLTVFWAILAYQFIELFISSNL